jgi:hypothetical protein
MLVGLIRNGVGNSPAYYIGYYLSQWMQGGFLAISAFLGALGSFFSGSTTVSNLTFGDIQRVRHRGAKVACAPTRTLHQRLSLYLYLLFAPLLTPHSSADIPLCLPWLQIAAQQIGVPITGMLAIQTAGRNRQVINGRDGLTF